MFGTLAALDIDRCVLAHPGLFSADSAHDIKAHLIPWSKTRDGLKGGSERGGGMGGGESCKGSESGNTF